MKAMGHETDSCKPQMNADERRCSRTHLRLSAFICGSYRKPQKPSESGIFVENFSFFQKNVVKSRFFTSYNTEGKRDLDP